jgi:hypothetical protein
MSKLLTYIQKQNQIKELQEEVAALEGSEDLKKEIAFKDALVELQNKFEKSNKDTLVILQQLDPSLLSAQPTGTRKARPMLTYKNPHTGEVVKTKGGNHKTLKEWRDKYGKDAVDGWKQG